MLVPSWDIFHAACYFSQRIPYLQRTSHPEEFQRFDGLFPPPPIKLHSGEMRYFLLKQSLHKENDGTPARDNLMLVRSCVKHECFSQCSKMALEGLCKGSRLVLVLVLFVYVNQADLVVCNTQEAGLMMQFFFPSCFSLVSIPTWQILNSYMGTEQYSSKT